ncbi:hypothetical protein CRUP_030884 [Coryphaenoides rupestris]|nr:hypothetical protein CRUP_030884 [Coryphaenoides rupestris]
MWGVRRRWRRRWAWARPSCGASSSACRRTCGRCWSARRRAWPTARGLSEQLQEAQESEHLLGCRLEEKGAEVRRLQQSEGALLEEVDEWGRRHATRGPGGRADRAAGAARLPARTRRASGAGPVTGNRSPPQRELSASQARLGDLERTTAQADREARRQATGELEDSRREKDLLTTQVKDLQKRMESAVREKEEAVALKVHMEEQLSVLQAQLRAKLNSAYTSLRREQGSWGESGAALGSLRSRYHDIRAKYDALLKKKSQSDLDVAPLKAKLSCLVLKCQERNGLLVQLMRAMRRQGCVDHGLSQQAEHLLNDAALQDYTRMFGTPATTPPPPPPPPPPPAAPAGGLETPGRHHHHHHHHHPCSRFSAGGFAARLRGSYSDASSSSSSPQHPPFSSSCSSSSFSTSPVPTGSFLMHLDDGGGVAPTRGRVGTPQKPEPGGVGVQNSAAAATLRPVPHSHDKVWPPSSPVSQRLEEEEEEEEEDHACYSPVASSKPRSPMVARDTSRAETPLDRAGPYHDNDVTGGEGKPTSVPTLARVPARDTRLRSPLPPSAPVSDDESGEPVERGRPLQPRRSASSLLPRGPTTTTTITSRPCHQEPSAVPQHAQPWSWSSSSSSASRQHLSGPDQKDSHRVNVNHVHDAFRRGVLQIGQHGVRFPSRGCSQNGLRRVSISASAAATATATAGPTDEPLRKTTTASCPASVSTVQPFAGGTPSTTASDDNNNNNNTARTTTATAAPGAPQTPRQACNPDGGGGGGGRIQPPASTTTGASSGGAASGGYDHRRASTTTTTTATTTATAWSPRERPQPRPEVRLPAAKVNGPPGRPKPEAPGSVGSVEVVRTNVDLGLPVHIGVQTLGSNGLSSDRVTAVYRTAAPLAVTGSSPPGDGPRPRAPHPGREQGDGPAPLPGQPRQPAGVCEAPVSRSETE